MKAILTCIVILCITFNTNVMAQPDQTINQNFPFELEKYLGTWYEIARYNHSFERNLQGVTATYSVRPDGKIKVVNQGYKKGLDGKLSTAVGKAKLTGEQTPRNFLVSFFWIFYSPYNILELDENYQHVLIGSGSDKYLWILSRTPAMDEATYQSLLEKARARGYDTSKLIKVQHRK
ncbi:MAG TPA: lipocalin family protein [Prolixibacteraceae bacterium]|nr:lipocalin family protein [Prolixibacteraceae bacterium]